MANNIWQGKRVRLRSIEPEDWQTHYTWDLNTEYGRLGYSVHFPNSRARAKLNAEKMALQENADTSHEYRFSIENLQGDMVGTLNTHDCDIQNGTFSYGVIIAEEHQRQGYASEAILLVMRYFFMELRYQKCTASVYSFNKPSIRLHERLGFEQEGRLRRMEYTGGKFHDHIYFGMTREEYEDKHVVSLSTNSESDT